MRVVSIFPSPHMCICQMFELQHVCPLRFNVLLDRCYATTSPYPKLSDYYDLFVGWVSSTLTLYSRLCFHMCSHITCLLFTQGVNVKHKLRWSSMGMARRHTSPLRPSDLWSTDIRQCPLATCTASPGSVRCPRAKDWCLWVTSYSLSHALSLKHVFAQFCGHSCQLFLI